VVLGQRSTAASSNRLAAITSKSAGRVGLGRPLSVLDAVPLGVEPVEREQLFVGAVFCHHAVLNHGLLLLAHANAQLHGRGCPRRLLSTFHRNLGGHCDETFHGFLLKGYVHKAFSKTGSRRPVMGVSGP
jgi:hypothetical protein